MSSPINGARHDHAHSPAEAATDAAIFRNYAAQYAEMGLAVFPLIPKSKLPFKGTNGSLNATTDLAEVAKMAAGVPNANIAIAPGVSGLFVVDEDPRNGGDESLATLPPLPETLTTNTGGGGRHFWFKRPAALDEVTCTSIGRGLDIKGLHSGYVLAPPSIHPNGSIYDWANTAPIAEAPAWLVQKILASGKEHRTYAAPEPAEKETDEEHGRRLALTMQAQTPDSTSTGIRFARALVWGLGLDRAVATKIWLEVYNPRCQPQWSQKEIDHKLDDASKPEGAPYPFGALHHAGDPLARLELITDFDSAAAALNDTSWLISCLHDEGTRARVKRHLDQFVKDKRAIDRALKKAKEAAAAARKSVASQRQDNNLRLCPDGRPWIVQKEGFFWHMWPNGAYSDAFPKNELGVRLERDLAPFIQIHSEPPACKRYTDATIEKLYIVPAHETRASYTAKENAFDPTTRVLTIATLKWQPLQPTFHKDVDKWLRILGGEDYARLEQWIASLPVLDRPAPILYLHADWNTGKNLLATGLGQIWGHSPGDFEEAISSFNGEQERTPLLFGDEGLPPDLDFQRLRAMVTEHSRRINEKFRPKYTLYGCCRIFVAANNSDVLRYQRTGTLTEADVDAIADRLLVIACPKKRSDEAREFLTTINTNEWASHMIAEHALWLYSQVPLEPPGQRMAAQPTGGRRLVMLMAGSRYAALIDYLVGCIERGGPPLDTFFLQDVELIKETGQILVDPDGLKNRLKIDSRTMKEAMNLLAARDAKGKPMRLQRRRKGAVEWFKVLDLDKVCETAAEPPDLQEPPDLEGAP